MYGHGHLTIDDSESKLSVRQRVGGVLTDDLWSMTDEQGNMWHSAMVTIDQQAGGQVGYLHFMCCHVSLLYVWKRPMQLCVGFT